MTIYSGSALRCLIITNWSYHVSKSSIFLFLFVKIITIIIIIIVVITRYCSNFQPLEGTGHLRINVYFAKINNSRHHFRRIFQSFTLCLMSQPLTRVNWSLTSLSIAFKQLSEQIYNSLKMHAWITI